LKRDLQELNRREFDLVVIGGGIFGICAAWDATLRGLSVAIVEKGDFAGATSANSFKVVHGGIRYLQHMDVARIRESARERSAMLRVAPHLVAPLPFVIPTYGHGMQGKPILRTGCAMYDMLTIDRNRGIPDTDRQIPFVQGISREECLERYPGLEPEGCSGAVVFNDAQMYNPPRLALSFLRAAINLGAEAANYVEVTGFLRQGNQITGVVAKDTLNGEELDIRGKMVINATGPWVTSLLDDGLKVDLEKRPTFSRDACFVVNRRLIDGDAALAVPGRTKDPDAVVSRSHRHLFVVPWRDYTLVGVWHVVHEGKPDSFTVTDEELQSFIDEINESYPPLELDLSDVSMWNAGLVLFGDKQKSTEHLSYGKRSRIIDHKSEHGLDGLISLIGIRYTTARDVARRVIDLAHQKLGKRAPASRTHATPIFGGDIEHFADFARHETSRHGDSLDADVMHGLLRNYGSAYGNVLKYVDEDNSLSETLSNSRTIKAEVIHAARDEMAQKLSDVIYRRTDLATGAHPGDDALIECARLMAGELGWDNNKMERELEEVRSSTLHSKRMKRSLTAEPQNA